MTDNLLQLIDLQADLLLADLNDRTKRCSIAWDRVSPTTYHCYFEWGNDWYDAYVTLMRGSYGLDLIKNERQVLNINSYINDQVAVLYYVVTDTFDDHTIKQIIQDINTLTSCKNFVRKEARGGVVVGGTAVVAYYKHVIGGVTVGGTASLAGAPAIFTNDGIAEYDGYSYSNFDELGTLLTSGTIDAPMGFFYGPGEFEYGDPCCKLESGGGTFQLIPPYVRINNYSGQFLAPFTPKTATYQKINGVTQSTVTQPSSQDYNLLGGQASDETVMLINIRSPNGVGYYKLFLNLIFGAGWLGLPKTVSIRAYMGYSNNTSSTYMPTLTSDFSGLDLTEAVAEMDINGDSMNAFEISDVIGEVIAQEWWDTSYGIMLEVRQAVATDSYSTPYNSLSGFTSPDIFEFGPDYFVRRSNAYIRFTMYQSGVADDSILSIVKAEEASSGTTTLQIRAVKDPNIAWPSSEADFLDHEFTTEFVSFNIDLSDEIGTQYDIDVTEIVQEIIDQEDWVPNNAIMFVLFDGAQLRRYHVQQIVSEIFTPISFATEENGVYPHATLTFTPPTYAIGGVTCGGTAVVGEGALLYMANTTDDSLEVLTANGNKRTILEGLTNIAGVRYDSSYGKIFWSQVSLNSPASPGGTKICCCNTDGTEVAEVITLSTFDGIRGFDLDRVNQKIYLVVDRLYLGTNLFYDVKRYNYDGSGEQTLVGGNSYICSPTSLVVNVENNYVFWCDNHGIGEGYIRRCELDGSNYTTILATSGYARAMCSHGNLLYLGGPGFLSTVEEDGSGQVLLSYSGLSVVNSLDVSSNDKIYISDSGVNKVFKTDIDGTNIEVLVDDTETRSAICMAMAL